MSADLKHKINQLSPQQLKALMKKLGKEKTQLPKMPRNAGEKYPVSSAQRRMWFLSKLDPASHLYTNPIGIRIVSQGNLDIERYVQGFREVVKQHEIMRTSFINEGGSIQQKIHEHAPFEVQRIDLRSLNPSARENEVQRILKEDGQHTIDIEAFPLFRLTQVTVEDNHFVLIYTSHHIISDAWSSSHIFRCMQEIYKSPEAILRLKPTYQFVDYVHWEQQWLGSDAYRKRLIAWQDMLPAAPPPLQLPLDYRRPDRIEYQGALKKAVVDTQLTGQLVRFSKQHQVNLFDTLLASFNVLLARYAQADMISVGVPLANRGIREFQQTVGMFLNTLPHVTEISRDIPFRRYLQRVHMVSQKLLEHQDLPFDRLIDELNPERSLAISPLFQVLFVFQNIPNMYRYDGLEVAPVKSDYNISKYDINLWVEEVDDSLYLSLTYQTSLFEAHTIDTFLDRYQYLLQQIVLDPLVTIADLALEKPMPTPSLPSHPRPYDHYLQGFRDQVRVHPDRPALFFGDETLSYQALDEQSNQMAQFLTTKGVKTGQVVAMALERSHWQILTIVALHKIGVAYLPMDPSQPIDRLRFMCEDAGAILCITDRTDLQLSTDLLFLEDLIQLSKRHSDELPPGKDLDGALAYIIYTSGSTGRPKGVKVGHTQLVSYCCSIWGRISLEMPATFGNVSSVTTDLGNTQIFPTLTFGGTIDLIAHDAYTNPQALAEHTAAQPLDCLKIVPSHLRSLMQGDQDVPFLPKQLLILGGEAVPAELVKRIRQFRPRLRILNHYGPTETTIGVLTHEIQQVSERSVIPIGRPLANTHIHLMDSEGRPVIDGLVGEIVVEGSQVAAGYQGEPEGSARAFRQDAVGNQLYYTGDLGRKRIDGTIEFLGRMDRQSKIAGHRVELEAVECQLVKHPQVRNVLVVPRQDSLIGYVETDINEATPLREYLSTILPTFMIPNHWHLMPEFPRLPSGKIDRQTLSKQTYIHTEAKHESVGPRDEIELGISHIWQEVIKPVRLHIHDSFFESGGSSLLAIELMARINAQFGTELGIAVLFQQNTIAQLAKAVRTRRAIGDSSHLVLLRPGTKGSICLVHPAGGDVLRYYDLAQVIEPGYAIYGIQAGWQREEPRDLKEMAIRYLRELEGLSGPVALGGWSMGALVAFEMARQWQQQGHPPVPVIILDQPARTEPAATPADDSDILVGFATKIEKLLGVKLGLNHVTLAGLDDQQRTQLFLNGFREHQLVPEEIDPVDFARFLDRYLLHYELTRAYEPAPYVGPTLLCRAAEDDAGEDALVSGDDYGWSGYTNDRLQIASIPGTHATIVRRPQSDAVAAALKTFLASHMPPAISQAAGVSLGEINELSNPTNNNI